MTKILVITDTPVQSGHHYNILKAIFAAHGVDYALTNVMPTMPDKELKKIKPATWLEESERLWAEARKHDKVLCAGSIATASFFSLDKGVPIMKVRGRSYVHAQTGKYTIPTIRPSTVVADQDFFRDLCFDIEKLIKNDGPLPQPELEVLLLETRKDLKLLDELHGASFLGCDTETTSLSSYDSEILGIGFCALEDTGSGYAIVIPQQLIGREVLRFLKTYKGTQVWHNLMFDFQPLWRKFGKFLPAGEVADTILMNWALDERPFNRYKSHALDLLQRLYFDAPPKSVNMGKWLEEYFRKDVGKKARWDWHVNFCTDHAEKARRLWREYCVEHYGEEPEWRGRKVGRDIPLDEPDLLSAVAAMLPVHMQPAPTKERKAQMWDAMMQYMGEDCFSTARLFPLLKGKMDEESPRLWQAHQYFDIPASFAFADMRLYGARVDLPYLNKVRDELEELLAREAEDLRALVMEYTAHPKGEEFNPNSSKQVKEVLYDKEVGLGLKMPKGVGRFAYKRDQNALTTNSDTLKVLARQVAKDRPAISRLINQILQYRVKSKILGTYIDGILRRVDPDERIRGDFNLHGTATARISASNPNLQNIPDASHVGYDIRRAYIPTPGWTILEADYSQLELRVAALFSQDELLIEAYRNGADIHQEVALMLWNKPKDQITKYERYLAKCMNFGVIYGRGAKSIATGPEMDNLVEMSGRSWGNAEIDEYFAKFKVGYADLFAWMELVKKDSMAKQYVENPTGHRRRFDLILEKERGHIERQTVNTPIQGFAARMTVHALVQLWKKFDPEKQRILFTVHDSIMCECISDPVIIQETSDLIKHTMENELPKATVTLPVLDHAPFRLGDNLVYNLPFVADVVVGPSWGECKDEAEHYVVQTLEQEYGEEEVAV